MGSLNLWGEVETQYGWAKCLEIALRVRFFEWNGGNDLHPIQETILKILCSSEFFALGC